MLTHLAELETKNRKILLRADFDVPLKNRRILDDSRIKAIFPTINYLLKSEVKSIEIITHLGRPEGKVVEELKTWPIFEYLKKTYLDENRIILKENLRFSPLEEENDFEFARELSNKNDIYINDAFAVSHRNHASIVQLPKLLPSAMGLSFQNEITALNKVRNSPKHPVIFVLGGAKLETKLPFIEKLEKLADKLLIGGKLAQQIIGIPKFNKSKKVEVAKLISNGKDITQESADNFASQIIKAGTVVWNGPMGVYEDNNYYLGTKTIAQSLNRSQGYSVIGGGDTEAAATKFRSEDKIDHISMGGGAMLEYLSTGTLPGLEALKGGKND